MKKLLASATAVTLLTVGYSSAAFAEKIQTTRIAVTLKTNKKLWNSGTAMDTVRLTILMT